VQAEAQAKKDAEKKAADVSAPTLYLELDTFFCRERLEPQAPSSDQTNRMFTVLRLAPFFLPNFPMTSLESEH
jgi:hypothetical protein